MRHPGRSEIKFFQNKIIRFWQESGRDNLPWRRTRDPWKVLVAELLLRKTTSTQAAKVYSSISRLSPKSLSELRHDQLMRMVSTLGMQRQRSRILREVGHSVARDGRTRLKDHSYLMSLRGVGSYSANAVMCFGFGEPLPALDRNMIRVLTRFFSFKSNRSRPHTDPGFWAFAETLVPSDNPREFNWGVLDLAAAVCKARAPNCPNCPLRSKCRYWKTSRLEADKKLGD